MLKNSTQTVEHMFNEACRELRLKTEDLIRRAYRWYFRGKCKSKRVLKSAIQKFKELHTFPSFVVDYLNNYFQAKIA